MKRLILFLITLLTQMPLLMAQAKCTIYDTEHIRSLQVIAMDDPILPPVMDIHTWHVNIGFDEMSHEYHRYIYHIDHCKADWTVSEGLFESNYLEGLNDQPIEDYEKSFNTTQIYTHYSINFPNEQTQLVLSGNYRVTVYDDDDDEHTPVLTAEFCLVEPLMSLAGTVNGNTDIDFQRSHQQVEFSLGYGSLRVMDPERELCTYVIQNRRADRCIKVTPNIRKSNGLEYNHQRALIFPGGSECHKFELLDVHQANMNVDNIRWHEPYYHATLDCYRPQHSYTFEHDANGAFILRNSDDEDNETTCEYVITHFLFKSDPLPGGDVYVQGNWCNNWPCEDYRMQYDEKEAKYHCAILLKQGYYDYRFVQLSGEQTPEGQPIATTEHTDGNYYQTENEYQILVYYREPGARYDRLVGYKVL
ncbi:MAG: DUF5103 domain-containing protein [Bacteroidaceae bacterium]|nr:DUF5103 domain-containing protein [Bacteroidaceae bacterium]